MTDKELRDTSQRVKGEILEMLSEGPMEYDQLRNKLRIDKEEGLLLHIAFTELMYQSRISLDVKQYYKSLQLFFTKT